MPSSDFTILLQPLPGDDYSSWESAEHALCFVTIGFRQSPALTMVICMGAHVSAPGTDNRMLPSMLLCHLPT